MGEEQENWQLDQRQTFGKREKTEDVERDLLGRETRALVLKDAWAERIGTHSRHGAAGIDGN